MRLTKQNLKNIRSTAGISVPADEMFSLPERVLQFGTGVLLRGLPDYFIDQANRKGIFNGRAVLIKSTASGSKADFDEQDNLYTICVRGIKNNEKSEELIINSAISRVLCASEDWGSILRCVHNPDLKIVISNTTEVGIVLVNDDIELNPPVSFPGKLLALLYERYRVFGGQTAGGMIIIPTELIIDNGTRLRSIVLELAGMNDLAKPFITWLETANHFCNSLVDRIVPGKLQGPDKIETEKKLGYSDELMIMAEPYRLWAIESDEKSVREALSFSKAEEGVIIAPDIGKFRELKLRLLNGTHTFSSGLAFLAGFRTVKDAMANDDMASFVHDLAMNEIAAAMSDEKISYSEAREFADKVIDRFRNPFIEHQWLSITLQYSAKMKMRNVPLLLRYNSKGVSVPACMSLGFAGYLLFMKCWKDERGNFVGRSNGAEYVLQDETAAYFAGKWENPDPGEVADSILADKNLWGTDLSLVTGFAAAVKKALRSLVQDGALATIHRLQENKTFT